MFGGDGGPVSAATVYWPKGISISTTGDVYIADMSNHRIRKVCCQVFVDTSTLIQSLVPLSDAQVNTADIISTVAGGISGYNGDGIAATAARLNCPYDVAVATAGDMYIADTSNNRIRKVRFVAPLTCFDLV